MRTDGRTADTKEDRHDKANSHPSQFFRKRRKNCNFYSLQDRKRTQKLPTRKNIRYALDHDRRSGLKWLDCGRTRCNCIQGGHSFFSASRWSVQIWRFSVPSRFQFQVFEALLLNLQAVWVVWRCDAWWIFNDVSKNRGVSAIRVKHYQRL